MVELKSKPIESDELMLLKIDPIFSILLIFISVWISFFRISGIEDSLIYKECLLFFEIRR